MTAQPPPTKRQARRRTRQRARELAKRADAILLGRYRLGGAESRLNESARLQAAALHDGQVSRRLTELPISELRRGKKGLRTSKLEAAGYTTVGDVLKADHSQLLGVPGVGEQSADDAKQEAERLARQLRSDLRFRFDPDAVDADQTTLLATLAAARNAKTAPRSMAEAMTRFADDTAPLLKQARIAGSRWRMFWARRATKQDALDAVPRLEALVDDDRNRALAKQLDEALRSVDPQHHESAQLWRQYRTNAAAFNTQLAQITGADIVDTGARSDHISDDLRDTINTVRLDGSRLRSTLRQYQLFGARYAFHQKRVILGDEMGLGKTIQALAVCAHLAATGQQRFIVVCPASVQVNWMAETEKHTSLRPFSLHGPDRDEAARQWLASGGVAITTFTTAERIGALKDPGVRSALLIVDEAHYIKNPASQRSRTAVDLMRRADRVLFLTGTPLENRVDEFGDLIRYLRPDVAARIGVGGSIGGPAAFRRKVSSVYLRRNQTDVLSELPEKIEVEDWVHFTVTDEAAYREAVAAGHLMGIRRAASALPGSAKLARLAELVEEAETEQRKVIIFSYFRDVLAAIKDTLGDKAWEPITGDTSPSARQKLIDRFHIPGGPSALVAQIDAGGTGLNIQAASVVIIAEPQWKPTVEDQAIARAHRMGQAHKVQVHRLLAKDTVDVRIREIQENKKLLFEQYARRSEAKNRDPMAVAREVVRPPVIDDDSIPMEQRVVLAERARLGIG